MTSIHCRVKSWKVIGLPYIKKPHFCITFMCRSVKISRSILSGHRAKFTLLRLNLNNPQIDVRLENNDPRSPGYTWILDWRRDMKYVFFFSSHNLYFMVCTSGQLWFEHLLGYVTILCWTEWMKVCFVTVEHLIWLCYPKHLLQGFFTVTNNRICCSWNVCTFQDYVTVLSGSYNTELPLWTSVYRDRLVLNVAQGRCGQS